MKLGIQAENPLEWLLIWIADIFKLLPTALINGAMGEINSKVIYAAFKLGILKPPRTLPKHWKK